MTTELINTLHMQSTRRNYQPNYMINYLFAVGDISPFERSPFQGFTPDVFDYIPLFRKLVTLPPNCFEPSLTRPARMAFHAAGMASWIGTPASIPSLLTLTTAELVERPFSIVFTSDPDATEAIARWCDAQKIPILHVSSVAHPATISVEALTRDRIREYCLTVLGALEPHYAAAPLERLRVVIDQWRDWETIKVTINIPSHLTTLPNIMVLVAGEYDIPPSEAWQGEAEGDYTKAIVQSYDAVQALRDDIPFQPIHQFAPPRPDVIIAAPAMYQVSWAATAAGVPSEQRAVVRRLLAAFERQSGFRKNFGDHEQILASPVASALFRQRIAELTLYAHAIGLRAASTLSAVIRVPPAVNRTNGVIKQLGRYARSPELRHRRDLIKTFAMVQRRLRDAIGPELTRCIEDSLHGVKIISDAPLEWLPMGELPLSLTKVSSRLTSTPGDLLIQKLVETEPLHLSAQDFTNILVLSSFKESDKLAQLMKSAIKMMAPAWGDKLNIETVDVSSSDEFVDALNNWQGPLVIFDGHGAHDSHDNIGRLMIGNEAVDVWSLRGQVRSPPIIILSACDTQAAGMSHATTANGFLALGARSVLATLLPVDGLDAAVFIARMMLRIAEFLPAAIKEYGRGLLWSEMVTGLLQMNFLSDLMMGLLAKKVVDDVQYHQITTYGNGAINSLNPNWIDSVKSAIQQETGLSNKELSKWIRDTVATSDAIRYVHMGNPETIVVGDVIDVSDAMIDVDPESEQSKFFSGASAIARELRAAAEGAKKAKTKSKRAK